MSEKKIDQIVLTNTDKNPDVYFVVSAKNNGTFTIIFGDDGSNCDLNLSFGNLGTEIWAFQKSIEELLSFDSLKELKDYGDDDYYETDMMEIDEKGLVKCEGMAFYDEQSKSVWYSIMVKGDYIIESNMGIGFEVCCMVNYNDLSRFLKELVVLLDDHDELFDVTIDGDYVDISHLGEKIEEPSFGSQNHEEVLNSSNMGPIVDLWRNNGDRMSNIFSNFMRID